MEQSISAGLAGKHIELERRMRENLQTMQQPISAGLAGEHIELERWIAKLYDLQDYLKSTKYSSYEMLKKMLAVYVSNPWDTPDTSELKQYLQAVGADERFNLLKRKYWCGETPLHAAASRGRTEVMRCLLQLVEPENQIQLLDIPNKYNQTSLDVARGEETVQLIRQYRESAEREVAEGKSPREFLSYVLNDLSLEGRQSLMSDERLRSKTFLVNWPHDGNLSGVKMAEAGFYCVDDYDRVQCTFCRGSLHKWEVEDNPMTEHIRLFPSCPFVKGVVSGIKQYKNENNTDDYDRVQCTFCHGSVHNWEVEDNPMTKHIKLFPSCSFVKGFEIGIKENKNENNTGKLELPMLRIAEPKAELAAMREVVSLERVEVAPATSDRTHNKDIAGTHKSLVNVAKSGRNGNRLKTDVISKTRHSAGCRECKGKRRTGNYPFKKCSHPKEFQHVTKQLKRIRTDQKAMHEEFISEYRASRCSTQDHPPTVPADLLSDAQQQEPVTPGTPAPPPVVIIEQPPPSVLYIADEQPGPSNAATARSATDRPINLVPPTFVQPPNLPATVEAVQEVDAEMDIMDE